MDLDESPEAPAFLEQELTRRRFLIMSAAAVGAVAFGGSVLEACTSKTAESTTSSSAATGTTGGASSTTTTMAGTGGGPSTTAGQGSTASFAQPLQVLSAAQASVLATVVDRLIPADTSGPSASQAGVVGYIDGALQQEADRGALFLVNLEALQGFALQSQGKDFAILAGDQQDAVLTAIQTGQASGFTPNAAVFFFALRGYTLEGMFSDPYYGGNKDFAGWHLIGFPGIRLIVPESDQKLDVQPPNVDQSAYDYAEFGFVVQGG